MKVFLSMNGESSKIENPAQIRANVARAAAAAGMDFEDLSEQIEGIRGWENLKALMEEPGIWVLNDSVMLHLAPKFPYVQISRDIPWVTSDLGPNCIGLFTQAMLESMEGVLDLTHVLTRIQPVRQLSPVTIHMVNDYAPSDNGTIARHGLAAASWGHVCLHGDIHYQFQFFESDSLPHVWNIMEQLDEMAPEGSLCMFTNRDICLTPESTSIIRAFMANRGLTMAHAHRVDVANFALHSTRELPATFYPGKDLFCWIKGCLPRATGFHKNLVLGREGWDAAFGILFGGVKSKIPYPVIYHLVHEAEWTVNKDNQHNQIVLSHIGLPVMNNGGYLAEPF
jgi:hypothetical protein